MRCFLYLLLLAALLCSTSLAQKLMTRNPKNRPKLKRQNVRCGAGPNYPPFAVNGSRIVNGTNAIPDSWPSMAFLYNGRNGCGASLLDEYHIVTAAHCTMNGATPLNTSDLFVGLAVLNSVSSMEFKSIIRKIIIPKYNVYTKQNNIAILRFDSPVTFSTHISPICLPDNEYANRQFINVSATAVGMGLLREKPNLTALSVQQVILKTTSNAFCKANFVLSVKLTGKMLCAAYPGKGLCYGDAGGPLFYRQSQGSPWVQIGIASIRNEGIPCGDPGSYTGFVRMTSYLNWIKSQINRK